MAYEYDVKDGDTVEIVNDGAEFEMGMMIRVDSAGGREGKVVLELTDIDGKQDTVRLISIDTFGQYFRVRASDFFTI